MSSAKVQNINIYPIKSSAALELSRSWVEEHGLACDRRFVITNLQGEFITARTEPTLCLVQASLTAKGLILTAPNMPVIEVNYHQLSSDYQSITVWKDHIKAQQCSVKINQWFSHYLNKPCQLLFFGEQSKRLVKNKTSQVGFADGYPLLLISQASLDDLNNKLEHQGMAVSMAQFRPNIVVNHCSAFDEDSWQHIRIGAVEFELTKPCSRCIFTTIDPLSAKKHHQKEPLTTLKQYRQAANGDVLFGQNLVALNQGQIKQGDQVEILQRKVPVIFITPKPRSTKIAEQKPNVVATTEKPTITFNSFNKKIIGNNQQTLLEQGEYAGLLLPYSCRAGMCGHCKVKLDSGEVVQDCQDGLSDEEQQQGYILACSSTPQSDVVISHPLRKPRVHHGE